MFESTSLRYGQPARGTVLSLLAHLGAIALLLLTKSSSDVRQAVRGITGRAILIAPYRAHGPGGGGGGGRELVAASQGRLPRLAPRQSAPPLAVLTNLNRKLPVEPTLIVAPDVTLPHVTIAGLGDPFGKFGPPSNGPGSGSGIGTGDGTGVGPGKGPGLGPSQGGNAGGIRGVDSLEGMTTGPVVLFKVEPEFSEEARKARLQGVVMLPAEVDTNGKLRTYA